MSEPIALPGAPLPMQIQPSTAPEIARAAEEFEAMFLAEMLAPMFESLDTDGLGGGGAAERMFRPMLVERYAEAIAQAGGVGLADSIIAELNRLQATTPLPLPPEADDGAGR